MCKRGENVGYQMEFVKADSKLDSESFGRLTYLCLVPDMIQAYDTQHGDDHDVLLVY
jgi:hypothetical protein